MNLRGMLRGFRYLVSETKNPLELLRQYRRGGTLQVRCRDGFEFEVESMDVYFVSSVAALCSLLKKGIVELREGVPVIGDCPVNVNVGVTMLEISESSRFLCVSGVPFIEFTYREPLRFMLLPGFMGLQGIKETFFEGNYGVFDFNKKRVLDVGGFIGDTTVYFAKSGAREVVAVEPLFHEVLAENVRLNGVEERVTLVKGAFSNAPGTTTVHLNENWAGASSEFINRLRGDGREVIVPNVPATEFFEKFGEFDIAKIDCEGCEYRVLGEVLMHVTEGAVVEFHFWTNELRNLYNKTLAELRSRGYSVEVYRKSSSVSLARIIPR
ncbi:FkbM family methyltransferase [Thermococcus nautili]|uniref:SAM-dependent methyltransferase n=1 Tax=Thermococcus nautili TaxID=195522 RepID=W8P2D8_9EURY|nr:FkbM family methyltransferase [Thermococcus nautili]AHL22946.1 SAM-dependent methyltransferase [Thermococcus nautili]